MLRKIKIKRERESLRNQNANLRQKQGFANSDLLIQDYESRNSLLTELENRRDQLHQKLEYLHDQSQKYQQKSNNALEHS